MRPGCEAFSLVCDLVCENPTRLLRLQVEQRRGDLCPGDPAGRSGETLRIQTVHTRQRFNTQQQ